MLNKLIQHLDLPDADYWYDVACSEARSILDVDSQVLLPQILAQWRSWPEMRQEHLAYILGEGTSEIERQILDEMAQLPDSEAAFRAREALRYDYPKK
ncbi:hypothetical protein [Pseudoduganella sp. HUAS MS19]